MRPALAAAALALAAGCSQKGAVRSLEPRPASQDRLSNTAPVGPRVVDALPFDYAALPSLEPIAVSGDLPSATFSFLPSQSSAELNMEGSLVAEIEVGVHPTASAGDMDLGGTDRRRKRPPGRYFHVFRQADETGPIGWAVAQGAGELCGQGRETGRARWQGYVHKSRTAEGLDYVCYEGTFSPRTCSATVERAWRVTARALVAGTVFGFRVRSGECSPPSMPPEERLAIIGPRPMWMASSAPLAIQGASGARSFTRLVVPIARAQSASAVFDTRPEDVATFRADRVRHGDPWMFSYSVEVVWPQSDAAPSAIAFSSVLSGNTSKEDSAAIGRVQR